MAVKIFTTIYLSRFSKRWLTFSAKLKTARNFDALRWVKPEGGPRHLLCQQTGKGLALWTVDGGGGRGGDELAGYVVLTEFFFQPFSSQRNFFLWSLKNMSVSFRVKDQSQAASCSPVYGVAEAEVQPAVGIRGGVTARCGPLTLWPPFGKSAQICNSEKGVWNRVI